MATVVTLNDKSEITICIKLRYKNKNVGLIETSDLLAKLTAAWMTSVSIYMRGSL